MLQHGRVEGVQAVPAANGGWPVCDPVLRPAGAAYGGSKETSTTVCGDEGRCVVCNLRKAGCSKIAYCCTTVRGDKGRCVVCNLRKAGCSLIAYCCTTVCGEIRQVCSVQFAESRLFAEGGSYVIFGKVEHRTSNKRIVRC